MMSPSEENSCQANQTDLGKQEVVFFITQISYVFDFFKEEAWENSIQWETDMCHARNPQDSGGPPSLNGGGQIAEVLRFDLSSDKDWDKKWWRRNAMNFVLFFFFSFSSFDFHKIAATETFHVKSYNHFLFFFSFTLKHFNFI